MVLFVIAAVCLLFQFKTLNQFPQYIHSWAQCDRYALALGFLDNGADFLHPQTYVMNNQFPGEFMIPRTTTITSVDFPIHDYIVSFIMRAASSTDPWCFRLYILLYSIAGLFFLYKLTMLFTPSIMRALFVVLFAMSSPVFLYYQAGFLPTIPSLANGFICLYFFISFLKNRQRKFFYLSVFFITLAVMARLPFAIVLVAMICFETFYVLTYRKVEWFKIGTFILSITCILAYYKYNDHLRKEYGSLFLNYILPASSFSELLDMTALSFSKWRFSYFNVLAYVLLGIVLLGIGISFFKKKLRLTKLQKQFLFLVCIVFAGCWLYYTLMTYQFMNHDYYFLDTFYIPVVCLFLFSAVKFPAITFPFSRQVKHLSLLIVVPSLIVSRQQIDESTAWFKNRISTADTYKGASKLLDSLAISKKAKLLVFDTDGSNNAFILLQRKGFVIIEPEKEKIKTALKWPYDYVVVENSKMVSSVYGSYPEVIQALCKVGGNGQISVYRRRAAGDSTDEYAFLGLDKRKCEYDTLQDFEAVTEGIRVMADKEAPSGTYTGVTDPATEYGFTFKLKNLDVLKHNKILKVGFYIQSTDSLKNALLCLSLNDGGHEVLFKATDIGDRIKGGKGWQYYTFFCALPKTIKKDVELGIFIWNQGKNNLQYDDFKVTIY